MKKLRAILIAIALIVGMTVAAVATGVQPASAAPSNVQHTVATDSFAHGGTSLFVPNTVQATDLLVFYLVTDVSGSVSVADSQGDAWSEVGTAVWGPGNDLQAKVYIATNAVGGYTNITVTYGGFSARSAMYFAEYSGLQKTQTQVLDEVQKFKGGNTTYNSKTLTTAAVTTDAATEMLVEVGTSESFPNFFGGTITGVGGGWTARETGASIGGGDMIVTPGGYAGSMGATTQRWQMFVLALRTPPTNGLVGHVAVNGTYANGLGIDTTALYGSNMMYAYIAGDHVNIPGGVDNTPVMPASWTYMGQGLYYTSGYSSTLSLVFPHSYNPNSGFSMVIVGLAGNNSLAISSCPIPSTSTCASNNASTWQHANPTLNTPWSFLTTRASDHAVLTFEVIAYTDYAQAPGVCHYCQPLVTPHHTASNPSPAELFLDQSVQSDTYYDASFGSSVALDETLYVAAQYRAVPASTALTAEDMTVDTVSTGLTIGCCYSYGFEFVVPVS